MKNIKFFEFKKTSDKSWRCSGLTRLNGEGTYTSFLSEIYEVDSPTNTDIDKLHVYGDDNTLYCIETTLCGMSYINQNKKKGLKIDPVKFDMSESVFLSLIGSIYTGL